jgi:hypothetical protein
VPRVGFPDASALLASTLPAASAFSVGVSIPLGVGFAALPFASPPARVDHEPPKSMIDAAFHGA